MRDKIYVPVTSDMLCCCTWDESEKCPNVHVSIHMKKELDLLHMLQLIVH